MGARNPRLLNKTAERAKISAMPEGEILIIITLYRNCKFH
jgi:hypothetical protein